jgi:hypothetical protein
MIHSEISDGFHTSQLGLNKVYKFSHKSWFFCAINFLTREDDKAIFSIPDHTLTSMALYFYKASTVNLVYYKLSANF